MVGTWIETILLNVPLVWIDFPESSLVFFKQLIEKFSDQILIFNQYH